MPDALSLVLGIVIGAALAAVVTLILRARGAAEAERVRAERDHLQVRVEELHEGASSDESRIEQLRTDFESAQREIVALKEKIANQQEQAEAVAKHHEESRRQLSDAFSALGTKALQSNSEQFLKLAQKTFENLMTQAKGDVDKKHQAMDALVKPIRELLEKQNQAVTEIEKKREVAYTRLDEQIKAITLQHGELRHETGRLVSALRRPEQRGRWGELQLENAVQLAGMSKHCDYDVQITAKSAEDERLRPDMAVNMPGGGRIVVDAKVAIDAYLDATAAESDEERRHHMARHAEHVATHYKALAAKRYWNLFEHSPKLVVMFMPLESALVAALEVKPELHSEAMKNNVLIATPTLLVALLRAVAYGWQQEAIAENARDIAAVGSELYERIGVFMKHFNDVGSRIDQAARSFNKAVGSVEKRVLPSTRKLRDLHATTRKEIESGDPVDIEIRPLSTPTEALPAADDGSDQGPETHDSL